jgi:protein gp37
MCDPFEDLCELQTVQLEFCDLIDNTPNLDWLLWTKRPEGIDCIWGDWLPQNVWLGVSCSTQKDVDEMVPVLLGGPASVLAVSLEPLVEAVDITEIRLRDRVLYPLTGEIGTLGGEDSYTHDSGLGWVIVGGESGPDRRPFNVEWAQRIHDDCKAAGVPFYMKQDSHFRPGQQGRIPDKLWNVKEVPKPTKQEA